MSMPTHTAAQSKRERERKQRKFIVVCTRECSDGYILESHSIRISKTMVASDLRKLSEIKLNDVDNKKLVGLI